MSVSEVWQLLQDVKDPEIPAISITELGIVRHLEIRDGRLSVELTPTFTSCPAYHVMVAAVERRLRESGFEQLEVKTVLDPPWSSDWITDEGRAKLRAFGIAIGARHEGDIEGSLEGPIACPYCGSTNTEIKNPFGPTRCRSICFCKSCIQPFEWIKPL